MSIGNFTGRTDAPLRAYVDGSDEGFLVFDVADGKMLKHVRLGHAQTQSVGRYRLDLPGLQILIANFWRNPGIVTLLDPDGNILKQDEMIPGSSHLEPVNWRGDGQEFALLSGNIREGGMIDGELRRVVDVSRRRASGSGIGGPGRHRRSARRGHPVGSDAGVDLHAGSAVHRFAHVRAGQEPALQRLELPRVGVAAGMGAGAEPVAQAFRPA